MLRKKKDCDIDDLQNKVWYKKSIEHLLQLLIFKTVYSIGRIEFLGYYL